MSLRRRALGAAGLPVAEVGFGAWAIGGRWGPQDDGDSRASIRRALDLGVDFFDTSETYGKGRSETLLGEALAERTARAVIATKVGNDVWSEPGGKNFTRPWIEAHCEASLRNLRREEIDLYQLHGPPEEVLRDGAVFVILEDLRKKGKILRYGVSIEGPPSLGLLAMQQAPGLSSLQVVLNLLEPEAAERLLPAAAARGVAIIARVPLASGVLAGKYSEDRRPFSGDDHRLGWKEERWRTAVRRARLFRFLATGRTLAQAALQWVLSFGAVSVVIPGCRTAAQVEENVAAAASPPLTAAELAEIARIQREEFPKARGRVTV